MPDEGGSLRERAEVLRRALAVRPDDGPRAEAQALLKPLRDQREGASLKALAEALLRIDPGLPAVRRIYAQALIDEGALVPALALLAPMLDDASPGADGTDACWGLAGRVHKQRFAELDGAPAAMRRQALSEAVAAYERPYVADPASHTWHGVNLLACVARARREGWPEVGARWEVRRLASDLAGQLMAQPADDWTLATLAEVMLALALGSGELSLVERTLRDYLAADTTRAFHVASTLRQFTEVWQLDRVDVDTPGIALRTPADVARARGLVELLRARLLGLPDGRLELPTVTAPRAEAPSPVQLEAVLGAEGARTYAWWRAGVAAAASVAVVRQRLGRRLGTGFLVRAGDLGLAAADPDERLLLTNFHVVNPEGVDRALRPEEGEAVFEAFDGAPVCALRSVVWCSPPTALDACLLRLEGLPAGLRPLPVSTTLPALPPPDPTRRPRVYLIGFPGGRELAVSMDDNELLDHEGPPGGAPADPQVWRVHYRAPTEGGSSGSPVFEEQQWRVIALHHAGGKLGMRRLNGQPGTYAANEGLAMASLIGAIGRTAS